MWRSLDNWPSLLTICFVWIPAVVLAVRDIIKSHNKHSRHKSRILKQSDPLDFWKKKSTIIMNSDGKFEEVFGDPYRIDRGRFQYENSINIWNPPETTQAFGSDTSKSPIRGPISGDLWEP